MKRFYFVLTAFIMLSISAWAQAYDDVTATYLKNADFSQGPAVTVGHIYGYKGDFEATDKGNNVGAYWLQNVTGWSIKQSNADGVGGAVFTYGTGDAHQLKGNSVGAPATGPDGTTGQALGFFAVWTNSAYYYQPVFLPAGNYKITYRIYNQSGETAPQASFFGFIPDGGTPFVIAPADLKTTGSWQTRTVEFTLTDEVTSGKIAIGYQASNNGSGANPMFFIDNVTIESDAAPFTDYTSYITNPSFEDEDISSWVTAGNSASGGDTGRKANSNDTYNAAGCDGDYLFNTWNGGSPQDYFQVSQNITLPAGKYVLYAKVATDKDGHVTLFVGDQYRNTISPEAKDVFTNYPVYFEVSSDNATVSIGARSEEIWFKVDDFRLFKLDDNTDLVPEHFDTEASDWRVSGGTATLNAKTPYYISKDDSYIVAQVSGVGTAIGDTKLTTLNNADEGHYPTYTWTIGGDTYFVWDISASRFSLWYTLGDNLSLGTANTQLNNGGTVFTFNGTPNIKSIASYENYNSLPQDVWTAEAYQNLTDLIAAAEELNPKLDTDAAIEAGIATAKAAANNTSDYASAYDQARSNLFDAIKTGLENTATEVDVTNVYIRNNSFESGWATDWTPNGDIDKNGDQNSVKELDLWGRDGNYIYNQFEGTGDNAGWLLQDLADMSMAVGSYKVAAVVCGANGQNVTLEISSSGLSESVSFSTFPSNRDGMKIETGEQKINGGSAQIKISTEHSWFRVDDFRLTYVPSSDEVDKTDLHRMILTAINLKELGTELTDEGYDSDLDNLITTYTALVNNPSATSAEVASAESLLSTALKKSFKEHNLSNLPKASAPSDGNYYLYNVATKSYVTVDSRWGTRAIANDYRGEAGILFGLEGNDDDGYAMSTSQIWGGQEKWLFASTSNAVNIDGWTAVKTWKKLDDESWYGTENGWAKMPWLFEAVPGLDDEGLYVYRLYRTSGDNRDYGMPAGSRLKYVMSLDRDDIMLTAIDADGVLNELYSYWILVSEADRIAEMSTGTMANPKNASFLIKNPDLEGQDAQAEGTEANNYNTNGSPQMLPLTWNLTFTNGTGGANTSQVGNANGSDIIGDRAIESWNSAKLDASQTITLPKAGLYRLRVNGFYRPGSTDRFDANGVGGFYPWSNFAAIHQHKGDVTMNAKLYAGNAEVPLMSINTGDQGTVLPFGIATNDKQGIGGFRNDANFWDKYGNGFFDYGHVPDDVASGIDRTREDEGEGRYSDNSLLVYAPSDNYSLTIGVKKDSQVTDDWTLFDHFNIWYMGSEGSAEFASAYNDYRKARIDAINLLFDTYHFTELRDTVYTRYLNDNGFDLTTRYGAPSDVMNAGDPKGTQVFALWIKDELKEGDRILSNALASSGDISVKTTQLKNLADGLNHNLKVAELGYQMSEFYFFSRGVKQFYEVVYDGSSLAIGEVDKQALLATNEVKQDIAILDNIEIRVLNTLKKAMGVNSYDDKFVMDDDAIQVLTDSLTTTYPPLEGLKMKGNEPSTNPYKDKFLTHAIDVARNMNPPIRTEFDLTFMLPRADLVGLEQWDWLPVFEWMSDDNPDVWKYNFDVHSGNNEYMGHQAFFAEKYRPTDDGIDAKTWAIYQNLQLPIGLYRFSAAAFAHHGGEDSKVVADNAYVAMNLASADDDDITTEGTLIPTLNLEDISTFYEIVAGSHLTDGLADVNVGMYASTHDKVDFASWIGMSNMRLYKIRQIDISEDRVYRVGLNSDAHSDGYSKDGDDFNWSDETYYANNYPDDDHVSSEEKAQNPYLFNISPAARITGVKRTFYADTWQTLTLPFDMSRAEFMAMLGITDVVINQFTGSRVRHYETWSTGHPEDDLGARVDLYFERETGAKKDSIYAHRPCLVWIPSSAGLVTPTWEVGTWYKPGSVEIVRAKEATYWPDKDQFQAYTGEDGVYLAEFSFDACYAGVNVGGKYVDGEPTNTNDGAGSYLPETSYYIAANNEFKYVPRKDDWSTFFGDKPYNPVRSKGLRGYFTYHGDSEAVRSGKIGVMSYEFDTGNGTDKIELNNFGQVVGRQINGRDVTGVYNINGQLLRKDGSSLEGLGKGVYIVNGNKVIIK